MDGGRHLMVVRQDSLYTTTEMVVSRGRGVADVMVVTGVVNTVIDIVGVNSRSPGLPLD